VQNKVKRWLRKLDEVQDSGKEVFIQLMTKNGGLKGTYQAHSSVDGIVVVNSNMDGGSPTGERVLIPMQYEVDLNDVEMFGLQDGVAVVIPNQHQQIMPAMAIPKLS